MNSAMTTYPGETWGISGPIFLALYFVAAVGVVAAAHGIRRWTVGGAPTGDSRHWLEARDTTDPYLAAYLNGGADLAVLAALSALRAGGLLYGRQRRCERVPGVAGRPPSELERAILAETAGPRTRAELADTAPVRAALDALRGELVRRRLLLSDAQRARLRNWALAPLGVLGIGVLRLSDGLQGGKPVGDLVFLMFLLGVAVPILWFTVPVRTAAGNAALTRLRGNHRELAPALAPSWVANGPIAAALGVAMFGTSALWTADPAFADELSAARSAYGPTDGWPGVFERLSSGSSHGSGSHDSGSSGGGGGCGGGGGGGCGG